MPRQVLKRRSSWVVGALLVAVTVAVAAAAGEAGMDAALGDAAAVPAVAAVGVEGMGGGVDMMQRG